MAGKTSLRKSMESILKGGKPVMEEEKDQTLVVDVSKLNLTPFE
jgi:hypothetical protein